MADRVWSGWRTAKVVGDGGFVVEAGRYVGREVGRYEVGREVGT